MCKVSVLPADLPGIFRTKLHCQVRIHAEKEGFPRISLREIRLLKRLRLGFFGFFVATHRAWEMVFCSHKRDMIFSSQNLVLFNIICTFCLLVPWRKYPCALWQLNLGNILEWETLQESV